MAASTWARSAISPSTSASTRSENTPARGAHRRPRRLGRAGGDQIGYRFGLGQVELIVQKRPLAKLARSGGDRTQLQGPGKQQIEHHRTAVAVQLQHVLTGKRLRAWEKQRDALVDGLPLGVAESDDRPPGAGCGRPPSSASGDGRDLWPRHAHHADPALARRAGDGGDSAGHGLRLLTLAALTNHKGAARSGG